MSLWLVLIRHESRYFVGMNDFLVFMQPFVRYAEHPAMVLGLAGLWARAAS
ncbi:MAG: hypothetical protein R3E93_01820 [Thiothrix sp.]